VRALRGAYGPDAVEIPAVHLPDLGRQLAASRGGYEAVDVVEVVSLRVIKREGFERIVVDDLEADQELQDAVLSLHHATMHTLDGPTVKIIENQLGRAFVQV